MHGPERTIFTATRRRSGWTGSVLALVVTTIAPSSANASDRAPDRMGKMIGGWVERVVMLPSQIRVSAKLDTGAKTSSIHAEKIERFEKGDEHWIRFTLVLEGENDEVHHVPMEAPLDRRVRIKKHDEVPEARPVVELDFCMAGQVRRAQFSLVDRGVFIYPVLLGRRFLAGNFVVDPDETFLTRSECAPAPDEQATE